MQSPPATAFSKLALLGPLIGFLLGLASALILEWLKRLGEKYQLVEIFRVEFSRTIKELEFKSLGVAASRPLARSRGVLFGVDNVSVRARLSMSSKYITRSFLKQKAFGLRSDLGTQPSSSFGSCMVICAMPSRFGSLSTD
jgi:hypothetical protein